MTLPAPRPAPVPRAYWALAVAFLALAGCGGGSDGGGGGGDPGGGCAAGTGTPMTVSGTILYERLVLSAGGLGPAREDRPARFVDVEVRTAGGGPCYGAGSTDAAGAYSVVVAPPAGTNLEVVAWSRTDYDPLRNLTVHDAIDPGTGSHSAATVFRRASAPFPSGGSTVVDLTVPYTPAGETIRPSIGFGVLDALVTPSESVRTATGVVPPLCHAYANLGNNGAVGTTFYSAGTGAITVLSGAAGNLDGSDTDYFDDPVLAHEYGHFVEFALAHSLNRGGSHGGEDLEPNFAWSEGQATGFGCVSRGDPVYRDSVGTFGNSVGSFSVENTLQSVRGIGSEQTIQELVWDLADGAPGIPDTDGDGIVAALAGLYGALFTFSPATDGPYLGLFLDRLVAAGFSSSAIGGLLVSPENQQVSWPLAGSDLWPAALAFPGNASGVADSLPGPDVNPCRGRLASVWYRLVLAAPAVISLSLDVQPIMGFGANLDLYLLDNLGLEIRASETPGSADEVISAVSLAAGSYLVRVEANCAGAGNRANFLLTVN